MKRSLVTVFLMLVAVTSLCGSRAFAEKNATENTQTNPAVNPHANLPGFATSDLHPQGLPGIKLNDLRLIPVQSGGRVKPFDEFARETILTLTGSRNFEGMDPAEMLISIMVQPELWANEPIIRVSNADVARELLLDPSRKFFSPKELISSNTFLQYAEGISSNGNLASQVTSTGVNAVTGQKDPRSEELKRVVGRMNHFQALIAGQLWAVTPPKDGNPDEAWGTLAQGMNQPSNETLAVYALLKSYLQKNVDEFALNAAIARTTIENATPQMASIKWKIIAETFYNRLRPFLQAMILYLLAGTLWLFSESHPFAKRMAKFLTFSAVILHVTGFALRCYVAGRPPVTNMYESIIWVSLGVMLFATIIYAKYRQNVLICVATFLAGLSLFAADAAPMIMDPTIRPLVPVLRSNYWLTIHVLTITISYAAFMLAMGIANVTLFQFLKKSRGDTSIAVSQRITLLNMLSYRALMFGTVLLATGTILGGVWADYSWGRFWGWDPKEVWALIALLTYMAVLHARYAGWVGTFGFPIWAVVCFSTVVMAWYGVNFVLGVGLHSYGFSTGGQSFVTAFLASQCIYALYVTIAYKRSLSSVSKNSTPTHA
jgi:cytochrome c-type biogenesis protein CcsB